MFSCVVCGRSVDDSVLKAVFFDSQTFIDNHVCSLKCWRVWSGSVVEVVEQGLPSFPEVDVSSVECDVQNIKDAISMMRNVFSDIHNRLSSLESRVDVLSKSLLDSMENNKRYLEIMNKQLRMVEDAIGGIKNEMV
jgi:hypothetical protein